MTDHSSGAAPEAGPEVVRLDGVSREFGGTAAVRDLDLTVARGEFTALLGPSGCGKTTTLRMIAGFLQPTAGRILLNGADATRLPPERRNIGMVFQAYALFPHLSVAKNVAFGLKMRKVAAKEVRTRVGEALELVGLSALADRRPAELSGGQQQRVALARAVAIRPSVLLLDEPLSNLDARLRVQMRQELLNVQRETGLTAILVTHDQEEALELADQMVILNGGRLEQRGAPQAVFPAPASRFVAEFLGYENFLSIGGRRLVTIRPEHVSVLGAAEPAPAGGDLLSGVAERVTYRGTDSLVTVRAGDQTVLGRAAIGTVAQGDDVTAFLPGDRLVDLPAAEEAA